MLRINSPVACFVIKSKTAKQFELCAIKFLKKVVVFALVRSENLKKKTHELEVESKSYHFLGTDYRNMHENSGNSSN